MPHDVVQLIATMIEPYEGTLFEIKTRYLIQRNGHRHKGVGFAENRVFLYSGGFDMPT